MREQRRLGRQTSSQKTSPREKWNEPRLTVMEVKGLALGILKSEIFTSDHVEEKDRHLLSSIFLPLRSLPDERQKTWTAHPPSMIYAYTKDAVKIQRINGYPVFDSMCLLWRQDTDLVRAHYGKLRAAVDAVMNEPINAEKRTSQKISPPPPPPPNGKLQSVKDFAACLGLSVWTIRGWAYRGRIASVKLGARMMIPTSELDRLIAENLRPASRGC